MCAQGTPKPAERHRGQVRGLQMTTPFRFGDPRRGFQGCDAAEPTPLALLGEAGKRHVHGQRPAQSSGRSRTTCPKAASEAMNAHLRFDCAKNEEQRTCRALANAVKHGKRALDAGSPSEADPNLRAPASRCRRCRANGNPNPLPLGLHPVATEPVPSRRSRCQPRQARKGAAVAANSGAEARLARSPPTERCPSGRRSTPGKCVWAKAHRGFESLPLRQYRRPHLVPCGNKLSTPCMSCI